MTDPLAQINVTIPCQDNVGSGLTSATYSGKTLLMWSQMGILECNAYRQGGVLRNGIWRGDPGFCQGALQCKGDFHASVHSIRASAGTEKWVIGNGINPNTETMAGEPVRGLNVWKWTSSGFRWIGWIDPAPLRLDENDNKIFMSLVGDFAYTRNQAHNGYIKFNLTSMTSEFATGLPESEEQTSIDGFTYKFEKTDVQHMAFIREGASVMLNFYPNEEDLRKQVASMIYNYDKWRKEHPGAFLPVPTPADQRFADVPPGDQFYTPITSLGMAGIVVGRP